VLLKICAYECVMPSEPGEKYCLKHLAIYYQNQNTLKYIEAKKNPTKEESFEQDYYKKKLRSAPHSLIKAINENHINKILGCSKRVFKNHLKSKFYIRSTGEIMILENRGRGGWEFDHRIPLSKVNLLDPLIREFVGNFENIKPSWYEDNRNKSNKTSSEFIDINHIHFFKKFLIQNKKPFPYWLDAMVLEDCYEEYKTSFIG